MCIQGLIYRPCKVWQTFFHTQISQDKYRCVVGLRYVDSVARLADQTTIANSNSGTLVHKCVCYLLCTLGLIYRPCKVWQTFYSHTQISQDQYCCVVGLRFNVSAARISVDSYHYSIKINLTFQVKNEVV